MAGLAIFNARMVFPMVITLVAVVVFLSLQLMAWRQSGHLLGMTPRFAKWVIALASSSLLAYATARLTLEVPQQVMSRLVFQFSFVWVVLVVPCVFVGLVVECILLLELAFSHRRTWALATWHAGAASAAILCLGILGALST